MGENAWWDEWRGSLDGRPTMWVKRLLRVAGCRLDLHKMMVATDDPECFHTHPAFAIRLVLRGGYIEQLDDGSRAEWKPRHLGLVRPELCHRIAELRDGPSFSLWLRFRVIAKVFLRGDGWAAQPQTHRAAGTVIPTPTEAKPG